MRRLSMWVSVSVFAAVVASSLGQSACAPDGPRASARRVEGRHELIGGPSALGEVGDWLLENDQIRIIVQDQGFSRGFGVFGGSLIDADLVRPGAGAGDSSGATGRDNFGEMFPAFFLEALEPTEVNDPNVKPGEPNRRLPAIEVESDGSDGSPAVLVVRGYGNDFLALTQAINEAVLDDSREFPRLLFTTRYLLRPGARYVEISTTVQNIVINDTDGDNRLTWDGAEKILGAPVPTPFGDVVLFGAGNSVFMPHEAGFDIRYRLEKEYDEGGYELPALPGITGEFVATRGDGVSYGVMMKDPEDPARAYAASTGQFEGATPHTLHLPFIASAFTGLFQVVPPILEPNDREPGGADEFTFTRYFIVGDGDVASISDVAFALLGDEVGTFKGFVHETTTREALVDAMVIVVDESGRKVTQCTTDDDGRFSADLRPGSYRAQVVKTGRESTAFYEVSIEAGKETFMNLEIAPSAKVRVTVIEPGLGAVPAKASLVGTYDVSRAGLDGREHLYDLSIGEHWRYTDLEPDTEDPSTRRYLEAFDYTADGTVTLRGRPGTYTLVVGRGPEYTRFEQEVTLEPGVTRAITVELSRVVDTGGYVSADFHLHSQYSLDSSAPLDHRLLSYAGEGLEYAVSTDHNFVVDYYPTILKEGLEEFMNSAVGLELTTIDRGHFNGFPLRLGTGAVGGLDDNGGREGTIASRTYGSFQWAQKSPQFIFDTLRSMGIQKPAAVDCAATRAFTIWADVFTGKESPRFDLANPPGCPRELENVIVQVNHPRDSILGYFENYGVDQDSFEAKPAGGLTGVNTTYHPEFAGEQFSWDFDAIEIFNGKHSEYFKNLRVPEGTTVDPVSCCPLVPGEVYRETRAFECDEELRDCACTAADTADQVAAGACEPKSVSWPGVVDDWFALLMRGKRLVGTANSDSHGYDDEEPAYPRTYVAVPTDSPKFVAPRDIVAGMLAGDVLMTNGPFIRIDVDGKGMGEVVDGSAGTVSAKVTVSVAPWIDVDRIAIYVNGEQVVEEALTFEEVRGAKVATRSYELDVDSDGFVVAEVEGDGNMFPTVFPLEQPSMRFTDVIGAIGGSFGFSLDPAITPEFAHQITPFAMTNPVWIDANGDGEITPAAPLPDPQARVAAALADDVAPAALPGPSRPSIVRPEAEALRWFKSLPRRKQVALSGMPPWLWPSDHPRDVRRVYWQFMRHGK